MIIFENSGEIDPRLISLIGVNVKERSNAIGYFGTGLKYAVACLLRWGEKLTVQSGLAEFTFDTEEAKIRGQSFGVLVMRSAVDHLQLGFTTDLGKRWEPWMVYRELWCNAHDEPAPRVYVAHRAGPDAYVTAFLLLELLKRSTFDQLVKWSAEPALLPKCHFGKHRGQKWSEVPVDYLSWILRQADMDDDVKHTARHWMGAVR